MNGNGVFWNGPIEDMPGLHRSRAAAALPAAGHRELPGRLSRRDALLGRAHSRRRRPDALRTCDPPDGRFVLVVHTAEADGRALPCERACARVHGDQHADRPRSNASGPLAAGASFQHGGVGRLVVGRLEPAVAAATMAAWEPIIAQHRRRGGRLARIARLLGRPRVAS